MNISVYLILLIGLFGVSFGAPLARFVPELAALTIAFWRMVGASTMLWGHAAIQSQTSLNRQQQKQLAVVGMFLGLHFALFYSALKYAPIANATLFATLAPIFTLLWERAVLKRHLTTGSILGLLIALSGVIIVQGGGVQLGADVGQGNLLALLSSLCMAVVLLRAERLRENMSNILYTRWVYLFAAVTLLVIILLSGTDIRFQAQDAVWLFGLAVLPTLLGHNSMSYAVKYLPPTIVGSMPFGEPILASILAWILFGERVGDYVLVGGGITLTGLIILTRYRPGIKTLGT